MSNQTDLLDFYQSFHQEPILWNFFAVDYSAAIFFAVKS